MKNISLLGAGMVGSAIARDLKEEYNVTVFDNNEERLKKLNSSYNIKTTVMDLRDKKSITEAAGGADLVIGAVPGFMGFEMFKTVVELGKNIVDISFFPEDPFQITETAESKNITAIFDCGIAPGLSNIILGHHNKFMRVNSFRCFVGGLPFYKTGVLQYKAPFSPKDVIEEYLRPAGIMENGKIIYKPALSELENIEIAPIGMLEAFNTDGLRSLLHTMNIPHMNEKTLRYPGHTKIIKALRDLGYFNKEAIDVNGKQIVPLELSESILIPQWKLEENEPEFTIMKIVIKGEENGDNKEYIYTLFDEYEPKTGMSSMARTTGFTCSSAARLILKGEYNRRGVIAPEYIGGEDNCFRSIVDDLAARGIVLNRLINTKVKN